MGGIVTVITAPVWILLGLALATLVVHFFLLLLGGAQKGLSTTFRTLAYTEATYLFQVLPLVGGVIAVLWWIPIAIVGLAEAHQTTTGRAAGAVLAPLLLCCVCVMVVLLVAGAAIMGALQNLR
ncbi:MAG: YIP1 family protein [Thermoanaerobaculum sp.]|nr:YIP1 family protein [Thermoanaerobaculum sp.]